MKHPRKLLTKLMAADAVVSFISVQVSLAIIGASHPIAELATCLSLGFAGSLLSVGLFWLAGLYSMQPRYLGIRQVVLFVYAITATDLIVFNPVISAHLAATELAYPPSLYFALSTAMLGLIRVFLRQLENQAVKRKVKQCQSTNLPTTLLVGAGDAGDLVLRELERMVDPPFQIVAVVDDNKSKIGLCLRGIPIVGSTNDIEGLVTKLMISQILIAMPSANGDQIRAIADRCRSAKVKTLTLPGLADLLTTKTIVAQSRDIDITDLLRRRPLPYDPKFGETYLRGEVVMITGGGGSIGSELARQVLRLEPRLLIVLGKGENSIFEVQQSLIQELGIEPVAVIADVRDRQRLESVFTKYKPSVVFHAAAHKHVPLMELSPDEAILNNILGTKNVVELAVKHGARKCILVSTDKAVNPENVMGATKRVSEMIVAGYGNSNSTDFAIVRFGNVLGSRGSLVPAVTAQIRRGGPVRITDPQMTRFFMTIPEATQLIISAGAMGRTGETFILDMGDPIRIVDIANDIIRLHGLEPNRDIEVVVTGARPGEKIHEELSYDFESLIETEHPKIRMVSGSVKHDWNLISNQIDQLVQGCNRGQAEDLRAALLRLARRGSAPHEARVAIRIEEGDRISAAGS